MKVKAFLSLHNAALLCITMGLMLGGLSAKAVKQTMATGISADTVVAIITRYDVKNGYGDRFREALKNYAAHALANENNIMVEAYSEQEQPLVMWVIERWNNKRSFDQFCRTRPFKSLEILCGSALLKPAQTIYVQDLEPVSRKQWRIAAAKADKPVTIMLFVNAQPGTARSFQEIYHKAMPSFRSEPGVINYQLSRFEHDSTRFVTYEKFRSEQSFQYHLNFPLIQPVIDYLNTSIIKQPFQAGLHRLVPLSFNN